MPYFPHFPFFNTFNNTYSYPYKPYLNKNTPLLQTNTNSKATEFTKEQKNSSQNDENYFFDLFGLKLYFDDVLLICLIFFLYQEGVKDEELFISLILLLLS